MGERQFDLRAVHQLACGQVRIEVCAQMPVAGDRGIGGRHGQHRGQCPRGLRVQLQRNLCDDPQTSFRTDEELLPVEAAVVLLQRLDKQRRDIIGAAE